MRRRIFLIVFSCILLILSLVIFDRINARNAAPMPVPSVSGGYYENGFTLRLTAPSNGSIYYTTDGSTPTTDSTLYQDGIPLENRSSEQNLYNSVQNVVTDWKNYTPDPRPVEKGTVIRAIFVNEQGIESEVLTQTYFVGITPPENGCALSLIFEDEDVFGTNGISVTGEEYDAWYESGSTEPAPEANFLKRGLEVPAIAELLCADGDLLNQPVGLRLQGHSARFEPRKRFALFAREEYGGNSTFDTFLFDNTLSHSVMTKNLKIDALVHDLVNNRAVSTQRSLPVRLYLNGEFWEQTYLLERYDSQYFRQHYNVPDRILVKDAVTDEDSAAVQKIGYYGEFTEWVKHTDFTDSAEWEQFQQEADLQSYIDYISINYYLCNYDFTDYSNYVLWRSLYEGNSAYEDGRWRWCIYDVDAFSFAKYSPVVSEAGMSYAVDLFQCALPVSSTPINETLLYKALYPNPEFRRQFVLSFMDIVNNNFAPDRVGGVLEQYGLTLDWEDGFFRERPSYVPGFIAKEFGLTGTLETVTVTASDPAAGRIQVNTSVIDLQSGSWSGQYFTDYPITLTATAGDGYRFVQWKGDIDETAQTITVPVKEGMVLEAVFEKLS